MSKPQIASVTCPSCGHPYATRVQSVVDVSEMPELKALLLQGRLNAAICPQCGTQVLLTSPFLYVDREKELAFVYMPQEPGLDNTQQQGIIGDLTNAVLNELPPEQRKAYLLQPKTFFTPESLTQAVLEADGVTPEIMEDSRAQGRLAEQFLAVVDDEETLKRLIQEHDQELDEEFFQLLTLLLEESIQGGAEEQANRIARLRDQIVAHSTWGQKAMAEAQRQQEEQLREARETLLEGVINVEEDEELEYLLAAGRPAIDYGFYQMLTERIESAEKAGEKEEAQRLSDLRDRILSLTDKLDKEAQAAIEQAGETLKSLLTNENMAAAVQEHREKIDRVLLNMLDMNIEYAYQQGEREVINRLLALRTMVLGVLREKAPPPLRLLDDLLTEGDPESRQRLLEEKKDLLDQDFLALVDALLNDAEVAGDRSVARGLQTVRQEVQEAMGT